ncbi:stage II sporulation protein M [Brevibacillus migulae]|uniref:stage II sporulation protein M n=1 Tax=Brevibacillus migulae TaxID=1644114 RepID=UPI00106E6DE2|nr:stage II sporulation protein M [Brevibacillus migulae]
MLEHLRNIWLVNKRYFYIAGVLLLAGAFIGFVQADLVDEMAKRMLKQIEGIAEKIKHSGGSVGVTFWTIFLNNVTSALFMMLLGVFFGIFPVFGLVSNGVLLGYIFQKLTFAGSNTLLILVVGILPHGILELPTVIFAAGVGIRYGILAMRSIGSAWNVNARGEVKREWLMSVKQLPATVLVIVLLLVAAALIESAITPALLKATIGESPFLR